MNRLIKLNKYYLVTQTYSRYSDHSGTENKTGILLSDYEDYAMAKTHWDALKTDPYRAVLDLHKPEHVSKIVEMLSGSKFALFWAVVSDVDSLQKHINEKYADNFRRYIEQHTNWRIGSGKSLRPSLQLIFGELFIILKFSGQTIRVKFEEIENT